MTPDPYSEDEYHKAEYFGCDSKVFCVIKAPIRTPKPDFTVKRFADNRGTVIGYWKRTNDNKRETTATAAATHQRVESTETALKNATETKRDNGQENRHFDSSTQLSPKSVLNNQKDNWKEGATSYMGDEDGGKLDLSARYDMKGARVLVPGQTCEVGCNFDIAVADENTDRHDIRAAMQEKNMRETFISRRAVRKPDCHCDDYWLQYPDLERCVCGCNEAKIDIDDTIDVDEQTDTSDLGVNESRTVSADSDGQKGAGLGFLGSCMKIGLAGVAGGAIGAAGVYLWFKYKE